MSSACSSMVTRNASVGSLISNQYQSGAACVRHSSTSQLMQCIVVKNRDKSFNQQATFGLQFPAALTPPSVPESLAGFKGYFCFGPSKKCCEVFLFNSGTPKDEFPQDNK